jgi:hypothetical protein
MDFTKEDAWRDAQRLRASCSKRNSKYIRALNRFYYNGYRRDSIDSQDTYPMSFWTPSTPGQLLPDLGPTPSLNIIRSCIETVKSKLSQSKPLPNFSPVKGTWKTRKVCRNAQIYFDDFFSAQKAYKKGIACAQDAMLFEYGVTWIDDEEKQLTRLTPWEFLFDPAEYNFGRIRRCDVQRRQYPLSFLRDKISRFPEFVDLLKNDPGAKVEYNIYYNMDAGKAFEFISSTCIKERKLAYEIAPFVIMWYRPPIKGWGSASMCDSLMTIQEQVDTISGKIHEAAELNPANVIFLPQPGGSNNTAIGIKKSEFSNQLGNIYPYTVVPGMPPTPVTVATPAPIDPMYIQLLKMFIEQAYQMEGVSQLSAQSKKPTGLNSGVALETLENVESERFNSLLQDYIHFYVEIADVCIQVFPENDDILPNRTGRASIKWKDIVKERKSFNIESSPVSNLSRDPQTKMEQIEKLISMQIIKPAMAASLLEFADIDKAYAITSASYDDCQKIIERAIETGDYSFYEVVDIQQLYQEAANTLMMLDADDEDAKVMQNLVGFIVSLKEKKDAIQAAMAPPPAPPVVPNPAPQPPPMVQEAAPAV